VCKVRRFVGGDSFLAVEADEIIEPEEIGPDVMVLMEKVQEAFATYIKLSRRSSAGNCGLDGDH
jgi:hypothetical protein